MKTIIKNRKGAEIPIIIFTLGVIALLFLVLIGAAAKKGEIQQKTFSVTELQNAYVLENTITYIFDRVFESSVIQAYVSSYDSKWISECLRVSYNNKIYRELCSNKNIDKDMGDEAKTIFLQNLEKVKESNTLTALSITRLLNPSISTITREISFSDDKIELRMEALSTLNVNRITHPYFVLSKPDFDYDLIYQPVISIDESLSKDIKLDSFNAIYNAINSCKSKNNTEVQDCVNSLLKNFNTVVKYNDQEKKLFFDLESKEIFRLTTGRDTIKINIYVNK